MYKSPILISLLSQAYLLSVIMHLFAVFEVYFANLSLLPVTESVLAVSVCKQMSLGPDLTWPYNDEIISMALKT